LSVAAPIARDITLQALFKGDPPLDAYPTADQGGIRTQQEKLRDARPHHGAKPSDRA
jgi:penicillin-binding protein 2